MDSFLDLLFPKHCVSCKKLGTYLCKNCYSKIEFIQNPVCPICQRQAFEGKTHPGCAGRYRLDGLIVACRYSGPAKMAIIKVKYKWIWDVEKVFVDLLSVRFWKFDVPGDIILVPVPLHAKRKSWRGFNQSEILAKSLAKKFRVHFSNLLVRTRETKTQVGLRREARKENVKDSFAINPALHSELKDKNIVLVDDVFTSGATMGECCKVLKKNGAKNVWALAVALG